MGTESIGQPEFVQVCPLSGVGKRLGYRVPPHLRGKVRVGCLVRVPVLGRSILAVVREEGAPADFPLSRLKMVHSLEQPIPVLTPDLLELAEWMGRYYACGLDAVLEVMMPAPVRKGMQLKEVRYVAVGRPPTTEERQALARKAPLQARVLEYLMAQPAGVRLPLTPLLNRLGVATPSYKSLLQKGWLEEFREHAPREAYADSLAEAELVGGADGHTLNPEQETATTALCQALRQRRFAVHLLHGVTGSGKTEVYLRVLQDALQCGGGAIFLVPEVALTPQTVSRLRARLEAMGVQTVVWHSGLSDGERLDAWHALASGRARVVVGARSAVFAPIADLRVIVVDEEHEPAYKQDEVPRYHGRDVAVVRAQMVGGLCLLGSATPSLESLFNVERGKYSRQRLTRRVDDRQLPLIHLVDMKREALTRRGETQFSSLLIDKMRERLEAREQTILFLNRRGFASSLLCPECGHVATCAHCSISLTYHRTDGKLRCHLCGYQASAPSSCPACRSPRIRWRGAGTQKIEDVVAKLVPQARVFRIDADTMQRKDVFREVLGDFRRGRIDILVGTQMIAKGLDFPNVTLVGLVDADISLHLPDFRSSERTFQLLVQVAGRAGRGERAGEVVIQSSLPHSPPIQFARRQDFEGFLEEELATRRECQYPPYRHLIHHLFRGPNQDKVAFYAEQFVRQLEKNPWPDCEIRGPAPAPVEKMKDQYRHQIWYFTRRVIPFLEWLMPQRKAFRIDPEVVEVVDVDAVSLL